ncbi:LytR C-terminal domain-containing protein [Actinophytocola sp. NPDC049390]|uniref:LytR C-terminal domain-containing protein n=1 Tax=Actinophytocola sp. NPDC049390 TaxID=3363894 RepID=UPI0037ADE540
MTSPDSGSTRPLRVAGVALLGVAVVALVIGLITMFGGNGDGRADGNGEERPPESTSTSEASSLPGNPPSSRTTSKSVPPTTTTQPSAPTTTTTTGAAPPGDGNGEPEKSVPVRVLNNSKIKGLAATAGEDLKADGWQVVGIGNYSATNLPETTVFFRPGTSEEAAARALAAAFGLAVEPRIDTLADQPAGVLVVVTNDYADTGGGKNEG